MSTTWRSRAKDVIAEVVKANPGVGGRELRKLLREAYPFGERRYHPYKIWCDEVNKTLKDLSIVGNLRNFWTGGG